MDSQDPNAAEAPAAHHYSGRNRVPNIKEFMASLDSDKKARDAKIDEDLKGNKAAGEVKQHKREPKASTNARTVRDPVTGKDVEIQDTDLSYEEAVENPQVCFNPLHVEGSTI